MIFFQKFNRNVVGLLAIVSGLICLVVASVWAIYSHHLTSTAIRTTGHIIQLVERHGDHGDSYFPVFAYTDRNGGSHTLYSNVGTYPPPNHVGDTVTVLYSAGAEGNAQIDDWYFLWGIPLLLALLGIVYLPVGMAMRAWPRIRALWSTGTQG